MPKEILSTDDAPKAIGPYAQATRAGGFVLTSGQIALDPKTGELVQGGTEAETKQVLANLVAVLRAAGATPGDVVKTTIFLADLGDFALVNRLYGDVFGASLPARSTVQVAALPKGARVEIEAMAYVGDKS
jgi:2-iminobutanoate/2-iminopropanoate deaminase